MDRIGRYRIVGELGRGAMGIVYHAVDPAIGRPLAIKTIRIRDIDNESERERLRERLFREARSAGVLSHPNIVTIYDMDEADGLAYIAMAYVNGPTLEKILASEQPLSGATMLRILRQTALALDYAHGKGIVHRDVKPANIMTDEDGAVKVTDFGIAKITSGAHSTGTKTLVGTPNYMSPEQVQGLVVDGRSDQFSLAVIAYEILTGERPFTGEHLSTVIFKIVGEDPVPAHRINGTLTDEIDFVLRKGLSKKPEDRYLNCSAFVGALEMACAASRGWKTLPAGGAAAMPTVAIGEPAPVAADPGFEPPRTMWRVGPALLGVTAVLAAMAFFAWRSGEFPMVSAPALPPPVAAERSAPPGASPAPAADQSGPKATGSPAPAPATRAAAGSDTPSSNAPESASEPNTPPEAIESPAPAQNPLVGSTSQGEVLAKPSPVIPPAATEGPAVTAPDADSGIRETVRIPPAPPQDVWVTSNPPGARAILDGDAGRACATPCMMQATPGVHHLTLAQDGFQTEYREIHVGDGALDIPTVTLRRPSGTLMLTTNPPGANIFINGRALQQVTPAQIALPPGTYTVMVEKNGRTQSETVQLHEGPLYLRLPLNP